MTIIIAAQKKIAEKVGVIFLSMSMCAPKIGQFPDGKKMDLFLSQTSPKLGKMTILRCPGHWAPKGPS